MDNLLHKNKLLINIVIFFLINFLCFQPAYPQEINLPKPGTMVPLSTAFNPPILKGVKVYPESPFQFDFICFSFISLIRQFVLIG